MITPERVDAKSWPYIAFLRMHFPNQAAGVDSVGTGTLIAPRLILTAGHNIFDYVRGGFAQSVEATLGAQPRVRVQAQTMRTTRQWVEQDSRIQLGTSAFDFGVVVLREPLDSNIRPLRAETTDGKVLREMLLNVAGYPASDLGSLYGARSKPDSINDTRIFYPIETYPGMSGGPVFDYDAASGVRTIRGIHTAWPPGLLPTALRITENVLSLIMAWQGEFRPV